MTQVMRIITTRVLVAALSLAAVAACDDTLTVAPVTEIEEDKAIVDARSARAALNGAYDALQEASYYGGDFIFFNELGTDNTQHEGTFTTFADLDQHVTAADNSTIEGIWDDIYLAVGRANTLILRIPSVPGLDEAEADDILGQAHLIRALAYHDLVRLWGPVPIRLEPPSSIDELANTERAPVDQVYAQIIADLNQAEQLLSNDSDTRRANVGAVDALRSRVALYRQDWAGVVTAADAVIAAGYELAPAFDDLFSADGNDTAEDIWRTSFTAVEFNNIGYYYLSRSVGGRREVVPTEDLLESFEAGDFRGTWTVAEDNRGLYGTKFPTSAGAEDIHIIRFAEVLLNKAEALARQNNLAEAVATYNPIRERAGLDPHVLGVDVTTQQEVLSAVWQERRSELALEGDRWPDLVRTSRAVAVLGIPAFRTLFPIPQNELDVAPRLVQNQGY
jgi:starch-binding outer membrane protein, SusD/RagB family